MATIGSLLVNLKANTAHFTTGMKKGQRGIHGLTKSVQSAQRMITGLAGALGVYLGASAFKSWITSSMQAMDVTTKFAGRIGMAVEELQRLQYAGKLAGVSATTMNMAFQRMTRRVLEAAHGTGEAVAALEQLNLSAVDLSRMTPDQQFRTIADAMTKVPAQANRVRLAFKLFDSEGVALVNTLSLGSDGIAKMGAELDKLGGVFSRVDAAKVEAANDAITRMTYAGQRLGQILAVELSPYIEGVTNKLIKMGTEGISAGNYIVIGVEKALKAIGFLADWLRGFQWLWQFVKTAALGALTVIAKAVAIVASGIQALINLIPGVDVKFAQYTIALADSLDDMLDESWGKVGDLTFGEMPSKQIERFFSKVAKDAEAAAAKVAARSIDITGDINSIGRSVLDATHDMEKLRSEAERIFDATATPLEKYEEQIGKLSEMLRLSLIDWETYGRAVRMAREELEKDTGGGPKMGAVSMGGTGMQAAMGGFFMPQKTAGTDNNQALLEVNKQQREYLQQIANATARGSAVGSLGGNRI